MRLRECLIAVLAALAACDDGPRPEPIVVYAPEQQAEQLRSGFAKFTADTKIPVTLHLNASATNTNNVINNEGSPPADVLITDNVADIWRAADRGALRPIESAAYAALSSNIKDPDRLWFGIRYRRAVIVRAGEELMAPPRSFDELAQPQFRGQLCLSTSAALPNRALIAMLIEDLGSRPAELVVRGWVQNLALPPFADDAKLMAAVGQGTCKFAISAGEPPDATGNMAFESEYIDIDAIGVARHARYPEAAQRLLDWVAEESTLSVDPELRSVAIAGYRDVEAQQLAERARYR